MEYRRELDGLRAIAVLSVIFFHADFNLFKGGFVGIDIFFVISGYLITTIILSELDQDKFSIANFYERRARRILPALFIVLLFSIPLAWSLFLPSDLKEFSQSLISVCLFASNIFFWRNTDYFDTDSEIKPLLHTWSLAVEEQFYILLPIFLLFFWKSGKRWTLVLLGLIFIFSFGFAQWASTTKPVAAFYLLPTRGWELLIGSFAAFYLSRGKNNCFGQPLNELGGWLGVVMIVFAISTFSKATPIPGQYTLAPTLGTLFVILFARHNTTVGQLLCNKALVGIGLISYSAYLWHQPLFAFVRQRFVIEPSQSVLLFISVLSLFLAFLSWKFIELPFRNKLSFSRVAIFAYASIGTLILIFFGLIGYFTDGKLVNSKRSSFAEQIEIRTKANFGLDISCDAEFTHSSICATAEKPEILLWGDSFAMHLAQGFLASNPEIKMIQKTLSGCGPFFNITQINSRYGRLAAEKCLENNDKVLTYLKDTPSINFIVLSSPFDRFVNDESTVLTKDGRVLQGNDVALKAMKDTIRVIKDLDKIPIVFSPPPQNGQNLGNCLKKASLFGESPSACDFNYFESRTQQANVWRFLKEIEEQVIVINLTDFLCSENICRASQDGIFIYRDAGHLSQEGSAYLGKRMDFFQQIIKAGKVVN
jgi:peptidoglycan/LPS O-acetylase OafA/YrhL